MKPKNVDRIFNKTSTSIQGFWRSKPLEYLYLITNLLIEGIVAALVSPGGVGKTQIALQLCYSVTTGEPFLGKFAVPTTGKILYLATEEPKEEIYRRLTLIVKQTLSKIDDKKARKSKKEELKKLLEKNFILASLLDEADFNLCPDDGPVKNQDRILKFVNEMKRPPKLIVLDNQTQLYALDHSSTNLANLYTKTLRKLSTTGACVLTLAHTNKSSDDQPLKKRLSTTSLMGSASFSNGCRTVIGLTRLSREEAQPVGQYSEYSDFLALQIIKNNFGGLHPEIIYLGRSNEGVLEYIPTPSPQHEMYQVIKIVKDNTGCNQGEITELVMKHLKLGKNEVSRVLAKATADKFLSVTSGKNNAKFYTVIQDKLEELEKELQAENPELAFEIEDLEQAA